MMVPGVGEGPRLAAEPRASLHLQPVTTQARTLIPSGRGQLGSWTPQPKQRVQSVFQGTKTIRGFSATDFQPTKHFRRTDLDTTTPCLVNPLSPWISERPGKGSCSLRHFSSTPRSVPSTSQTHCTPAVPRGTTASRIAQFLWGPLQFSQLCPLPQLTTTSFLGAKQHS